MNPENQPELQEDLQPEVVEQDVAQQEPVAQEAAPSKQEVKAEEAAQQAKKDKRSNLLYAIIAIVFVLVGITAIVWNSGVVQNNATAVTMNGEKYTAAEVNYHFTNAYQSFVSSYGDYLAYIGLDTTVSLKDQIYDGEQTWYDYFLETALYQLSCVAALQDAAAAEGYVYTDAVAESVESIVTELNMYAPYYGYTDGEEYLVAYYGSTMDMDLYSEMLLKSLQAEEYATAYQNSLVYDDAALDAAYAADSTNYDFIDYEMAYVYNAVASTDADGNVIEVTDEMTAAAYAEAQATANIILEDYQAGASLSDVCDQFADMATYSNNEGSYYGGDLVSEWLYEDGRQDGDSTVIEVEGTTGIYVLVFHDRYREEYNLIDVRHILVMPETGTLVEGDDGYEEELADLNAMASAEAQAILDEYLAGDQSEDSFATLAGMYSEDSGSYSNGGLYESVAMGEMVAEFEDWCFDASREAGDIGIVETSYGYHIMYFSGLGDVYWKELVKLDLLTIDYNAWFETLMADYTPVTSDFGMGFVG